MQASPPLDGSISVTVHGGSICCSQPLGEIAAILRGAVLDAVHSWIAANPDRDPAAPLPPVALTLLSPYLLFALRTDTCAL